MRRLSACYPSCVSSAPLLPERDAALQAAAELTVGGQGFFRRTCRLGDQQPTRVAALAAVVVVGKGGRRAAWTRSAELSELQLARLAKRSTEPRALVERTFAVLVDSAEAVPMRCTNCMMRPGYGPCPRCIGTGKMHNEHHQEADEQWIRCDCSGGFVRCTLCGGTQRVLRVDVQTVTDSVIDVEEWVVPNDIAVAAQTLRALGPPATTDAFACELESTRIESAYRGAAAMAAPRFFDFELLDAAARARERLAQLTGTLSPLAARTYAVPFFFLHYTLGAQHVDAVVRRAPNGEYAAALCMARG